MRTLQEPTVHPEVVAAAAEAEAVPAVVVAAEAVPAVAVGIAGDSLVVNLTNGTGQMEGRVRTVFNPSGNN